MNFLFKKYLPEFVYGSVDGVITTVAIITGAIGIGLQAHVIFILGVASVLGDGFSMGSSKYLSSISRNQLTKSTGVRISPGKKGFITFSSFVVLGFIPLIPFLISVFVSSFIGIDIILSLCLSLFAFVFIGYIGARFTNISRMKNIIRTVIVGSIAASISFIIGYLLNIII